MKVLNNERGLTLIEVLVAFVILTMTLVTVMDSFALGSRQNAGTSRLNTALTLAQSKIEETKHKPFNNVMNAALTDFSTESDYAQFDGFSYTLTVEPNPAGPDDLNKTVTVTVFYSDGGVDKQVALTAEITKR
ncbi:MAG: type II secretion system protein [Desulfotomaculaceae bacterium]|nr:type II secretion system protein [Desulfotomaculaceae bacterium]